ncbi:MAG: ATPase [Rhodospirillaceae bacterium]|nr:ATPase [Rhodospirillaceae bacterium]
MKRFYKKVTVENAEEFFIVTLDGKPLLTPGKKSLLLPNQQLADKIASEWQQQNELIQPHKMPNMSLASTAIDRVAPQRMEVIDSIVAYGSTDLLCYRAFEPEELVDRQHRIWQPLLDWAKVTINAELLVTAGIMPLKQPDSSINAIRAKIIQYNSFSLVALHELTSVSGSVIIGLAVIERYINLDESIKAAQLDTIYQIERWGEDPEVMSKLKNTKQEMSEASNFIALLTA